MDGKRFVDVGGGRRMAWVEAGEPDGMAVAFLHGNPTSSYLWRDVWPSVADAARVLAPDLIGMGDSDKLTDVGAASYTFAEHAAHLDAWFDAVVPTGPVVLVVHDWGSALGFHWANRNRDRVAGIAYMEALVMPMSWQQWPEVARPIFQSLRSDAGEDLVLGKNLFVENILPASVLTAPDDATMAEYRRPFAEPGEGRRPTLTWPRQIPLDGEPADVAEHIGAYADWLEGSEDLPKLFVNADPGMILTGDMRDFARTWPNQTEVTVPGLHFVQEDSGVEVGNAVRAWMVAQGWLSPEAWHGGRREVVALVFLRFTAIVVQRRAGTSGLDPAPVDPRTDLPAFGSLPVVADLDEVVTRVIAPNPSPLTLDGTNTYVVGEAGAGVAVLVDPGPADPDHLARVEQALSDREAQVAAVVVTHHHEDHSEAARQWGEHFGAIVHAPTRDVAGADGVVVVDGDVVGPAGARVVAVTTPGHCADHTAYRAANGALLIGDHVLGRGTSVVAFPDGDLLAYLDSLAKVQALGPDVLYPGHGPEMVDEPAAVLTYYAAHRAHREQQVIEVLRSGPATSRDIVEVVYAAYDPSVWAAAEASTQAALAKLRSQGVVDWDAGRRDGAARLVEDRSLRADSDADDR